MSNQLDWPRYSRWTWIIAILALIVLLWLWMSGRGPNAAGCCVAPSAAIAPSAVVAPVTIAPTIAQAIKASWDGGKLTLEGVVGSDATKKTMLDAAIAKYGAGNVIDKLAVDVAAKGDVKITLMGDVDSEAVKTARGADMQAFYPGATIDNQLVVKMVAAPVTVPAASAAEVQCGDKMAIAAYFVSGSAKLTAQNAKLLNAVVACIKGPFEIGGHTDSNGGEELNQILSELRARTVSGYLVRRGVDPKLLTVKGYGASVPIADNATADGRAKNRRIEFKKM